MSAWGLDELVAMKDQFQAYEDLEKIVLKIMANNIVK
jgi:hypothetical protein